MGEVSKYFDRFLISCRVHKRALIRSIVFSRAKADGALLLRIDFAFSDGCNEPPSYVCTQGHSVETQRLIFAGEDQIIARYCGGEFLRSILPAQVKFYQMRRRLNRARSRRKIFSF